MRAQLLGAFLVGVFFTSTLLVISRLPEHKASKSDRRMGGARFASIVRAHRARAAPHRGNTPGAPQSLAGGNTYKHQIHQGNQRQQDAQEYSVTETKRPVPIASDGPSSVEGNAFARDWKKPPKDFDPQRLAQGTVKVSLRPSGPVANLWGVGVPRFVKKDSLLKSIENQFRREDCREQRRLVVPPWNFGFGSYASVMGDDIELAKCSKRLFVLAGWYKAFDATCRKPGMGSCILEDISYCTMRFAFFNNNLYRRTSHRAFDDVKDVTYGQAAWGLEGEYDLDARDKCAQFVHESTGTPYSHAVKTRFFVRPHPDVVLLAEKIRRSLKITPNCISMHVRRGDKIKWGEAKLIPLSKFVDLLRQHVPDYHKAKPSVYIASDDKSLFQETEMFPDINFVYRNDATSVGSEGYDQEVMWSLRKGSSKGYGILMDVLVDLLLLSSCRTFIGQMSSNVSRLTTDLMYLHFGPRLVTISAD